MGGSQEPGGLSKQPVKKAQLAKLKEAAVGSKPIAEFFCRKSPKRRMWRPNKKSSSDGEEEEETSEEPTAKRQRGGRKYVNSTTKAKSSKASKLSKVTKLSKATKSKSSKAKKKSKPTEVWAMPIRRRRRRRNGQNGARNICARCRYAGVTRPTLQSIIIRTQP